jgi:hypothetical protein
MPSLRSSRIAALRQRIVSGENGRLSNVDLDQLAGLIGSLRVEAPAWS